jgi:hypothetical protein
VRDISRQDKYQDPDYWFLEMKTPERDTELPVQLSDGGRILMILDWRLLHVNVEN